jgi:putative selenium metabolism protein SsnA
MILIGNGVLITQNAARPLIQDGCVAVDGTTIADFGTTAEIKAKYPQSEFNDARGGVIMPGLINTHGHIYSAMARGMSLKNSKVSKNFTQILENLWWRMDRALDLPEILYSAYTTYIDGIKNGVTTVFDHHASAGHVPDSLFTIAEAAETLGVRTSLCYEVSDRDGQKIADEGIKENADFIAYASKQTSDMIKGLFGLHASFTLSEETLDKCVTAANGAGFHVHTAEGIDDLFDSLKKYGKRVVERLNDASILGPQSIAVHCIHINAREMDILKHTDTVVVHNPESNMGNAVGCSAALHMMDKGILMGLGTDGYTTDMLESFKVANIIHKHNLGDPSVGWGESAQMLLTNNAKICARHFNKPLGVIEKGALADIIIVDYDAPTPITESNTSSHILFGMTGRSVRSTMINGRFVMKDRELLTADEREVYSKARELAAAFWERA